MSALPVEAQLKPPRASTTSEKNDGPPDVERLPVDTGSIKAGYIVDETDNDIDGSKWDPFEPFPPHPLLPAEPNPLTVRAVLIGWVLGSLVNACNVYLGLKAGVANDANMLASFAGFLALQALFRSGLPFLSDNFGPMEHNIIQTVATSTGGLSTLFISSVPAMFQVGVLGPNVQQEYWKMAAITATSAAFGSSISPLFRSTFVVKMGKQLKLVYPSAVAVATTIRSLHLGAKDESLKKSGRALYITFAASTVWVVATSYAKGILFDWYVFWWFYAWGNYQNLAIQAVNWGFITIEWTPAFIGMGMLVPLNSSLSWLGGYIFGFGIAGPIIVAKGLAVGLPYSTEYPDLVTYMSLASDDYINQPSPRYWLLWPAVIAMVAAGLTDVLCHWRMFTSTASILVTTVASSVCKSAARLGAPLDATSWLARWAAQIDEMETHDPASRHHQVKTWEWSLLTFITGVFACVSLAIQFKLDVGLAIVTLILGVVFAVLAVQCTGQVGVSPISAVSSASQLVVGGALRGSSQPLSERLLSNLASGAMTGTAAQQVTEMTTDFKIGFFLGTPPRTQWLAQLIGTVPAVFLSPALFLVFARAYSCIIDVTQAGRCEFSTPAVQAYSVVATSILSPTFPVARSSLIFGICLTVASVLIHIGRYWASKTGHTKLNDCIPNMVMVNLGLILPASQYGLALSMGGIAGIIWARKSPSSHALLLFPIAAGMMAGESIGGLVNAVLTLANVSGSSYGTTLGCPGGFC